MIVRKGRRETEREKFGLDRVSFTDRENTRRAAGTGGKKNSNLEWEPPGEVLSTRGAAYLQVDHRPGQEETQSW